MELIHESNRKWLMVDSIQNSIYEEDQNISILDIIEKCDEDVKLITDKRGLMSPFFILYN